MTLDRVTEASLVKATNLITEVLALLFFIEKNKNKIQTTTESLILAQDER